ncbi:MAG: phosphomannose isomerase type II C-terminal cupin domain [Candidatus Omnitrophica bacterium]|nr:phosphomannose isomerase type II C-terminal cupin domain [Candidatus Omnitrophota bacterium]MCB9746934.1 phosphomannose isomerase type II C-terminal cupin domain [Candidatus Omnitrophota bacterium]
MDIQINVSERPWGYYIKFLQESGVWVKRVEVKPGARLSLQKHSHRSEKWNIVTGEGVVTLDDKEIPVKAGSVIDVPLGAVHRIANTGQERLVFIEVACGEHLSEDDIERIQDDYDRGQ